MFCLWRCFSLLIIFNSFCHLLHLVNLTTLMINLLIKLDLKLNGGDKTVSTLLIALGVIALCSIESNFCSWEDSHPNQISKHPKDRSRLEGDFSNFSNSHIVISGKLKLNSKTTFQYKVPPKTWGNSPQKPLLDTQKCFFGHCYVQNVRFLKIPQCPDFEIFWWYLTPFRYQKAWRKWWGIFFR